MPKTYATDQRERYHDKEEALRAAFEGMEAALWTALPGIVHTFDPAAMTCSVQPAMKARLRDQYGNITYVALPLLLDCPVQFMSGGGCTLTVPIQPGDEGLVVFASRCIDGWWQLGGAQIPPEMRMHDLSDGFFLPGFRSQPRTIAGVSTTAAQLRTDDGATFVEVDGGGNVKVHGAKSYEWDVQGYGQKVTWTGGANYTIDNYTDGATVTTNTHSINPPGPP